ncbi:MAG: toll/interleukin-1 receptor domain-containing protein [Myxacorys chilensis ATA2-1-KO14]|jgi:hypothetical protein|nr:toll/interleukin-1 receptor domain-containing protein [Myxacorys chilensis ATA2-1-KO14]
MEAIHLKELLEKIQQIQFIMIGVATDYLNYPIRDEQENYVALWKELTLEFELLQEDGVHISNPNFFKSLWDWHYYYKNYLDDASSKRKYVYELYLDAINAIENELYQYNQDALAEGTASIANPTLLEDLVSEIEKLKSIMIAVAIEYQSIDQEESKYSELYQEIASKLGGLRRLGIPAQNPNIFRCLWHWHSYFKCELGDSSSRRCYIYNLYTSTTSPIEKALLKHRRTPKPIEQFIEDLQRRFREQVSEQSSTSEAASFKSIGQDTSIQTAPLPAGNTKAIEPDSEGMAFNPIPPKVFISYSYDSQEHKDRVWRLADRLREDGINCTIDQHEESPAVGWHRWMLNQVEAADFVLVVCTEHYERRFRGDEELGSGKGVTWEGAIIIQELYNAQGQNSKFIPIIFTLEDADFIPSPLRSATFYRVNTAEGDELLYRRLTNQSINYKRELGQLRTLSPRDRKQTLSEDSYQAPLSLLGVDEKFGASDRSDLADLLKRSGRADSTSRKALCQMLGLDPGNLNFISLIYSDRDFAIALVNHLFETGHDLTKLCDEIKPHLQGQYAQNLQSICNRIKLCRGASS